MFFSLRAVCGTSIWRGGRHIATHYAAIGFDAPDLEDLEEQVQEAVTTARHVPCGPSLDYAVWEDASGAALWVQIENGVVTGAHPFFAQASAHAARVEGAMPYPDSDMDGQVRLYLLPGEAVLLPVDVVNWAKSASLLREQTSVTVRLAAFAEGMESWPTPEAYAAANPQAGEQGLRWIVPTGLYPEEQGGTGRSTANVTGVVVAADRRVNGLTRAPFVWLQLETAGATLDAVAPDGPLPSPGGVARGHFWLAGMVEATDPDSLLTIGVG